MQRRRRDTPSEDLPQRAQTRALELRPDDAVRREPRGLAAARGSEEGMRLADDVEGKGATKSLIRDPFQERQRKGRQICRRAHWREER